MAKRLKEIFESKEEEHDEKLFNAQHAEIKKQHGKAAVKTASFGHGSGHTDEGHPFLGTKTEHGYITSTLNTKTGKVSHEWD